MFFETPNFSQTEKETDKLKQQNKDCILNKKSEINAYIDNYDKQFSSYLKSHWETYEMDKGISPNINPKPRTVPKYCHSEKQNKILY